MSGFVATAPAQPANAPEDILANDGWFPDVSMAAMRNTMRVDGTITDQRLHAALVMAMATINRQLRSFKSDQSAAGHANLAQAGADEILAGQPVWVQLYHRAVLCTAKADLIERYRDFDADHSRANNKDNLPMIDEERRNAQWAVRDILGQTHVVAELI